MPLHYRINVYIFSMWMKSKHMIWQTSLWNAHSPLIVLLPSMVPGVGQILHICILTRHILRSINPNIWLNFWSFLELMGWKILKTLCHSNTWYIYMVILQYTTVYGNTTVFLNFCLVYLYLIIYLLYSFIHQILWRYYTSY